MICQEEMEQVRWVKAQGGRAAHTRAMLGAAVPTKATGILASDAAAGPGTAGAGGRCQVWVASQLARNRLEIFSLSVSSALGQRKEKNSYG